MAELAESRMELARIAMADLVRRYEAMREDVVSTSSSYSEEDTRQYLITPMLKVLGWDTENAAQVSARHLEVVTEQRLAMSEEGVIGFPDYKLRVGGEDVMPVEAKKPSVSLKGNDRVAQQTRSYGWSLGLPAAVLTNFEDLVIFDTQIDVDPTADWKYGLIPSAAFHFDEYVDRFDELWRRLSRESLGDDGLARVYGYERPPRGDSPFDRRFLTDFTRWRRLLAQSLAEENPELSALEVGRQTQKVLNALFFLRVCEDRQITKYEALRDAADHQALIGEFRDADRAFNAGLFTVLDHYRVSPTVLAAIVNEMYWPKSPYAFGVIEPETLAGIYEQYLGQQVVIDDARQVALEMKPELLHADGVVTTPTDMVRRLCTGALAPILCAGEVDTIIAHTVLDPAVGSGVFLVEAFRQIEERLQLLGVDSTLAVRRRIVESSLYGVDIDPAAVEVARLSLLLLVIGDESLDIETANRVLPSLAHNVVVGNSVVRPDFARVTAAEPLDLDVQMRVSPLDLLGELALRDKADVVISNPPYVRIPELQRYFPEQLAYLQNPRAKYRSARTGSFDLYQVFIERVLNDLVKKEGRVAMIVPNRLASAMSASFVRDQIAPRLERWVDFGTQQVFAGHLTYTALLFIGPGAGDAAEFEYVEDLPSWRAGERGRIASKSRKELLGGRWVLASPAEEELFRLLDDASIAKLGDPGWVRVFVAVQTSLNDVFIVDAHVTSPGADTVAFRDSAGRDRVVEAAIMRPAILKQKIAVYDGQLEANRMAFFPYRLNADGRPEVISRDQMEREFPRALAYFEDYKEPLTRRNVVPSGQEFWAYGRSQALGELDQPKLICTTLSLVPRYGVDREGILATGGGDSGPYTFLRPEEECPYSLEVVQSILSHPAVDLHVMVHGKKFQGGYASHRKAFLEGVPLPRISEQECEDLERNAIQLGDLAVKQRGVRDELKVLQIERLRRQLMEENNAIITKAFGIDPALLRRVVEAGS